MANLGAEGVMKVTVEGSRTTGARKAIRVYWDGSNIECGSGCGIMIKAVGIGSHSAESLLL